MKIRVKKLNDFILGVIGIGLGAFLCFSKHILSGVLMFKNIPFMAKPETYTHFVGILMIFMSVALLIQSLRFKEQPNEQEEAQTKKFKLKKETIITMVTMLLFVAAYEVIGFPIPALFLVFIISTVFGLSERQMKPEESREPLLRFFIIRVIYAAAVVGILMLAFNKLLKVQFF